MGLLDLFSRKPTIESFARELTARFERMGQGGWSFDAAKAELKQESSQTTLNLSNIFLEYSQADRSVRSDLLEKYCAMADARMREIPKLWTLAQKNIFPVLRSRFDLMTIEIANRGSEAKLPVRTAVRWFGDVELRIAYDFGPHTSPVDQETAAAWGVPFAGLRERAQQNLNALAKPRWNTVTDGVFQIESAVSYEESMVLRADVWRDLPVQGDKVMIPSNRGVLLGAGTQNPVHVVSLLRAAREALQNKPWPLEPTIVTRRGEEILPYDLPSVATEAWGALSTLAMAGVYKDQQDALQQHLGEEVFVATFGMFAPNDNPDALTSYCTWTQDVVTWLPRADRVAFNKVLPNEQYERVFVPWSAAERICAHYMTLQKEDPPRWLVTAFPNDTEWWALQAASSM
jgi:hypothetical protein